MPLFMVFGWWFISNDITKISKIDASTLNINIGSLFDNPFLCRSPCGTAVNGIDVCARHF
jgi:hypothetical protein